MVQKHNIDVPLSYRELAWLALGKCITKRGTFVFHNEGHADEADFSQEDTVEK